VNVKINNALKLIALCVIIFSSCKTNSFVSRKYMKGRFVERIGDLAHKKISPSESNKVLKAQPLIEEKILNKDSVENDNSDIEQTSIRPKKNNKLNLGKFEVVKDSTNNKEKKDEPPAKRKYKRVLRGFAWVAGVSSALGVIVVLLDFLTNIYFHGFIWEILLSLIAGVSLLSIGILFILLFIYVFLKQTKKFRSEADESKKGYTNIKWEYLFLLLVHLNCVPIALFGPFAIIPSLFVGVISFIYYHKERKLTKETDFFNYKRTSVFMILLGILLMLSFVLGFSGIF